MPRVVRPFVEALVDRARRRRELCEQMLTRPLSRLRRDRLLQLHFSAAVAVNHARAAAVQLGVVRTGRGGPVLAGAGASQRRLEEEIC